MITRYWINRIINNYKANGMKLFILSGLSFMNKVLNPKHTGEIPFKYFFIKKRRAIMDFSKKYLDKLDDNKIIPIGNYLINSELIDSNSIVYSCGVGTSISFERELLRKYNCVVHCFDPTSLAVNYMNKEEYDDNKIKFKPIGIWNKDEKVKFYTQDVNETGHGGSITNLFKNENFELFDCAKIKTLMKKNNHLNVDLLKLDIEGAAIAVMDDILEDKILPKQILVEFEYSEDDDFDSEHFAEWSSTLQKLIDNFRKNNYRCYNLPRVTHIAYSTIEVLFVKN